MTSSRRWRHVIHASAQVVVMWTLFFGIAPWFLAWAEQQVGVGFHSSQSLHVGVIIWFAGFGVISLWSAVTMAWHGVGTTLPYAAATRLVVVGPYRFVRNPMTLAGLAQGLAVGVWWGSPSICGGVLVGGWFWFAVVRPREERELQTRFGDAYNEYRRQVRALVPGKPFTCSPPSGNA